MILVTGASGFIGSYVLRELEAKNMNFLAMTSNPSKINSTKKCIVQDIHQSIESDNLELIKNCDSMIHLAWKGLPHYKELYHLEENLFAQYKFIKTCIQSGIRNITITGTCLEYGLREGELSTDLPTSPFTSYALAKDCLHKMLLNLQQQMDFQLKWVRLFYIYGEGQPGHTLYGQLIKASENADKTFPMSKGDQERDYLHVQSVAKYIVSVSGEEVKYKVYNCSSGKPSRVIDFVNKVIEEKKINIELNPGFYPYPEYEPKSFWGKPTPI